MKRLVLPLLLLLATAAFAQAPDYKKFVAEQFGDSFTFEAFSDKQPVLVTDLDGDGKEDMVLQARSKSPLDSAEDMHYRVIDPFDTYWGWGDPNDTSSFTAEARNHDRVLLIVHDWHGAQAGVKTPPKTIQKFVVINLPFDELGLSTKKVHKKPRHVLEMTEQRLMRSYVFWDGKNYRYIPGATIED